MFGCLSGTASFAFAQNDADLDAAISKAIAGETIEADKLGSALELYRRKLSNKRSTAGMKQLTEELRDVEPVVVGPNKRFKLAEHPLQSFRMVYVSHLAKQLPPAELKKHPTSNLFPGEVPEKAPRVSETISLNKRAYGWISTGLYAPPGEVVTVNIPRELSDAGLKLRIGPHSARLRLNFHKTFKRYHSVDRVYDLDQRKIDVANAFGGLIYIVMPTPEDKRFSQYQGDVYGLVDSYTPPEPVHTDITVEGAVRAPYYKHGETNLSDWRKTIRNAPAPWAELATDKVIFTLPSSAIREFANPGPTMEKWDEVLDAMADLRGSPRTRPLAMRFMIDAHVNYGLAYAGYPINAPLQWSKEIVSGEAGWGHVHELGHLHQYKTWTYQKTGEVTVNLFSLYALETVYGDQSKHRVPETFEKRVREWLSKSESERDWTQTGRGFFERLNLYVVLIEEFGWDPLKKILRDYRELPIEKHPKDELDRAGDFALRYSRETNKNLVPLFEAWGVRMSPSYTEPAEQFPAYESPTVKRIMNASS